MVDVLLIYPPLFQKKGSIWKALGPCFPALGLAYLAAYIREKGFSVHIMDMPALKISIDTFEKELSNQCFESKPCYVGFTAMTSTINNAYELARITKTFFPETKIIFGGIHPSILPEEALKHDFIDFVIAGEGEITLFELLSGKDVSKIDGLIYKKNGKAVINKPRERIKDLDKLPFPAYDLLPMSSYYPVSGTYKRLPAMSMVVGRGCPGKCTFCYKTLGNKIAYRSAESLIEEIQLLKKEFGIKQIMFYDDTFTIFKENVKRFCELLIEKKVGISWCCFSRIDFVDFELLKLMKESGCHQILYGLESGSQEILKRLNKKIDLEQAKMVVSLTKLAGIDVRGTFMLGNPGETKGTLKQTLDLALSLSLELAIFNITTPFPGTRLFNEENSKGHILSYNWDDYDFSVPILKLDYLTNRELTQFYRYCYRKFYLRPSYLLFRFLRILKNPKEIHMLYNAFKSFISFIRF